MKQDFLMPEVIKTNNLYNFVLDKLHVLSHVTHLIIDLTSVNDNNDEIVDSINKIKRVYENLSIIILADSEEIRVHNKELLVRIFDRGIFNIITTLTYKELAHCILDGKSEDEAHQFFVARPDLRTETSRQELDQQNLYDKKQVEIETKLQQQEQERKQAEERLKIKPNKDFRKFKSCVTVAICGSETHIGVTHNALLITRFLKDIGFKVCYLEACENHGIFYLKSMFPQFSNFNEQKHLLQFKGLELYSAFNISEVMTNNYDMYVFDLGVLSESKLTSFLTKDIKIIIGGGKAWELNNLLETLKLLKTNGNVNILVNYPVQNEKEKILNMLGGFRKSTYFLEHVENPFEKEVNLEIYKNIFKEYVIQEQEKQQPVKVKKGKFARLR